MPSILDDQEIHDYIQAKAGSMGLSMIQLIEQGFTTINELAEELRIPRRATRKVLYQMNKAWIVGYKRFRQEGMINFQWFTTPVKIRRMVRHVRQDEIHEIEERIQFEQDHKFFECVTCKSRCMYTEAMDFGFICERCGEPLEAHNNDKAVEELRTNLKSLIAADDKDTGNLDETKEISESFKPVKGSDADILKKPEKPPTIVRPKRPSKKKADTPQVKVDLPTKPESDEDPFAEDEDEVDDEEFLKGDEG